MKTKLDRVIETGDDILAAIDNSKTFPDYLREFCRVMIEASTHAAKIGDLDNEEDYKKVRDAYNRIKWPDGRRGFVLPGMFDA